MEVGFSYGIDVEADLKQRLMVEVVSAVKDEGGFFHAVEYPLVIQIAE